MSFRSSLGSFIHSAHCTGSVFRYLLQAFYSYVALVDSIDYFGRARNPDSIRFILFHSQTQKTAILVIICCTLPPPRRNHVYQWRVCSRCRRRKSSPGNASCLKLYRCWSAEFNSSFPKQLTSQLGLGSHRRQQFHCHIP